MHTRKISRVTDTTSLTCVIPDHRYCVYNGKFTIQGNMLYYGSCTPWMVYNGNSVWATVQKPNAGTVWKIKGSQGGNILITPASGKGGYLTPMTATSYDEYVLFNSAGVHECPDPHLPSSLAHQVGRS